MGLDHLNFSLYWKNLTSPLSRWHRGTASQFDILKDHPQLPIVLTDFGTDVVIVTMAARIVQSIISLGRNLLQKRSLYWTMLPRVFMSKALRAVVVACWSVIDVLLPLLMSVYIYKKRAAVCKSEQGMNTVTIKCHWGSLMEPDEMMDGEFCSLKMETVQEIAKMEVDCESEPILKKEVFLPSCTNPVIMSMICLPTEELDSSEESEGSVKGLDLFSQEEMSMDSGLQESWTPGSNFEEDLSEESDWSDEDSWDEESNSCHGDDNDDLWASFCRTDDPYNPLSFAMPTKGPKQPKKEVPVESLKLQETLDATKRCDVKMECGSVTEEQKPKAKLCKKPVLSGYKSTHQCMLLKEEAMEEADQNTKKVHFSSAVTVHPIVTWSFAHRMARKGPWEEYARDRCRFQRRIAETEAAIDFCLTPHHRSDIWATRYANPTYPDMDM